MKRTQRILLAISAATALMATSSPVFAAQTVTVGTKSCTVTAKQPTLSSAKQLTGMVTVTCNVATTVTAELMVVEMDGTVEQLIAGTSRTGTSAQSLSVAKGGTVTFNSFTVTCVNTEVGNEEYASKGRVLIAGTTVWSGYDRFAPANDWAAC